MNDKIFLDTNILVYCYSVTDQLKQRKAVEIASKPAVFVSTQVLQELCNTLSRKFKLDWGGINEVLKEVENNFAIYTNSLSTIISACLIAKRFQFSFYDSMIVAAALECDCTVLASVDMQHGQIIDNQLTIINPFA